VELSHRAASHPLGRKIKRSRCGPIIRGMDRMKQIAYWMTIPSSSFSVEVSAASTSLMSLKTKMKIQVIEALLLHLLHYHQVPHPQ
jgi:hypothetical protein